MSGIATAATATRVGNEPNRDCSMYLSRRSCNNVLSYVDGLFVSRQYHANVRAKSIRARTSCESIMRMFSSCHELFVHIEVRHDNGQPVVQEVHRHRQDHALRPVAQHAEEYPEGNER